MVYIPIFKINIMFYLNKFYQYVKTTIIFFIMIDLNSIGNINFFYYNLDNAINFFLIFYNLLFKVNINKF